MRGFTRSPRCVEFECQQGRALRTEGRFARDRVLENKADQAHFKAIRRRHAEHPVEEIGAKLRAMMPWIGANKLVAGTKD